MTKQRVLCSSGAEDLSSVPTKEQIDLWNAFFKQIDVGIPTADEPAFRSASVGGKHCIEQNVLIFNIKVHVYYRLIR